MFARSTKNGGQAGERKGSFLFFQPKLSINQPGDVYEQEADRVAEQVMRMEDTNSPFFKAAVPTLQRRCAACEEEDHNPVQRREQNGHGANATRPLEDYVSSLSGGQSLPAETRQFFEPKLGQDFSDVRIHTGSEAADSAQAIRALAYTTGNNIVFNAGQYTPDTEGGKRLLAHELTHVVQQRQQPSAASLQRAVYVCDEYRSVAPTTYTPGPGLTLTLSGNAITIQANLELYGTGASATVAGQMKATIERVWNASFSDGYSVSTVANVTVQGASPDTSKTRIDVRNEAGVTNVAPTYWIAGANYMQYYLLSSNINWTPAHEFGHLLGLPDHYSESIVSVLGGLIDPSWRTTTQDAGWEGNLMAVGNGVLEKKNLEELIRIGFRARHECVRGHMESAL